MALHERHDLALLTVDEQDLHQQCLGVVAVSVNSNTCTFSVMQLLWEAFVGPVESGKALYHKDLDKSGAKTLHAYQGMHVVGWRMQLAAHTSWGLRGTTARTTAAVITKSCNIRHAGDTRQQQLSPSPTDSLLLSTDQSTAVLQSCILEFHKMVCLCNQCGMVGGLKQT